MSASRFVAGLTIGWFAGLVLGLLVAPQPGQETQRQVREALREIMDAGKAAAHEEERRLLARYRELISRA